MGKFSWGHPSFIPVDRPWQHWVIHANITLATFLVLVSSVATLIADPNIQGAMVINSTESQWISTAYLIMLGLSLPLSPWLAEKNGYKRQYFISLMIFLISAICGGLAPNYSWLLGARILEGMGAGMFMPISLTIIARAFPPKQLPLALGIYVSLGFGAGLVAGFLLGGYSVEYFNWRVIFLINLIMGFPAVVMTLLFHQETEKKKVPAFDFWGYFFFILFLSNALFIVANVKAPWNTEGWTSTFILTCASLSSIGFVCLLIVESKHPHPLIPLVLFKSGAFSLGCITMFYVGSMFFGSLSVMTSSLIFEYNYDKLFAAKILGWFGIVLGLVGSCMGYVAEKIDVHILAMVGVALMVLSAYHFNQLTLQSDQWQILTALVVSALGVSLSLAPLTTLSLLNVPKEYLGAGSGLVTFCRQMGSAFGGNVMGFLIVQRHVFHTERFGTRLNPDNPAYQRVFESLKLRAIYLSGESLERASAISYAEISNNLNTQASLAAKSDVYYIFGVIGAIICCFFIIMTSQDKLRAWKKKREAKS